jgi:uridine phosphorylase
VVLTREPGANGWTVRCGRVWTTDAPYRETKTQLEKWAGEGVLAVEMQTVSLFSFGFTFGFTFGFAFRTACGVAVATVAMVSNAVDHESAQFDTGSQQDGLQIIQACARAFRAGRRAIRSSPDLRGTA